MPIRRVTIELDDSVDQTSPTNAPESLTPPKHEMGNEISTTPSGLPDYNADEYEVNQRSSYGKQETGRTFPDLIADFKDDPRAISTVLMFVPFIVFAPKIESITSLKYPIITGGILNFTWFVLPWIGRIIKRLFNKK